MKLIDTSISRHPEEVTGRARRPSWIRWPSGQVDGGDADPEQVEATPAPTTTISFCTR